MKDNLPNYLNPHNIDPSRIEPAHIEDLPGFDSIRPGMNIGTVGVVGRGHPKLQLPTMSNVDAINILKNIETDIYGRIAIAKAIDALSSPWVKTADRLPTEADAGFYGQVMTCYHDEWDCFHLLAKWDEGPVGYYWYWHGLPMSPEVEE